MAQNKKRFRSSERSAQPSSAQQLKDQQSEQQPEQHEQQPEQQQYSETTTTTTEPNHDYGTTIDAATTPYPEQPLQPYPEQPSQPPPERPPQQARAATKRPPIALVIAIVLAAIAVLILQLAQSSTDRPTSSSESSRSATVAELKAKLPSNLQLSDDSLMVVLRVFRVPRKYLVSGPNNVAKEVLDQCWRLKFIDANDHCGRQIKAPITRQLLDSEISRATTNCSAANAYIHIHLNDVIHSAESASVLDSLEQAMDDTVNLMHDGRSTAKLTWIVTYSVHDPQLLAECKAQGDCSVQLRSKLMPQVTGRFIQRFSSLVVLQ
jgi:hypothetical protein